MKTIKDTGEKRLIEELIKPLFNPNNNKNSIGDDCAIIEMGNNEVVSLSTDRVPHDLIALKIGLIDYFDLGYYLAVLNISDIVSSGTKPHSLLLNLAFPSNFLIEDFNMLLEGINVAAKKYNVSIVGGDLSSCPVISLSATSIGKGLKKNIFYREGALEGDIIYCSDYLGLTSTSFNYFLKAKQKGFELNRDEEKTLINQFKKPHARIEVAKYLNKNHDRVTAMDNTDGIGQSLSELSGINDLAFIVHSELLPIHDITKKVSDFLKVSPVDIALGAGADFQLLGTVAHKDQKYNFQEIKIIGEVSKGAGVYIKNNCGKTTKLKIEGWNYFDSDR